MNDKGSQEETLRSQDAWQRALEHNRKNGFPYSEHELRKIHRKWRSLGREVRHPASMRNTEHHN